MSIEYTPTTPQQQPAPKSEFVLVKDVTGKPIPKRGPQVLKAHTQDKGKPVAVDFKVPYPPKDGCKKCYGRGYIGFVTEGGQKRINLCAKCYPVQK